MPPRHVLTGMASGFMGTFALRCTTAWLYRLQGERSKRREQEVRPRQAMEVFAERIVGPFPVSDARRLGDRLAVPLHWVFGLAVGATYGALYARSSNLTRWAGLPFGALLWLVNDEGMNTALGLTPPPQKFPLITHVRGLVAHLAFGVATAAVFRGIEQRISSKGWEGPASRQA